MDKQEEWLRHMTELRKRLIVVLGVFGAALAAGLYVSPQVLLYLKRQPAAGAVEWNVFAFTDGLFVYLRCAVLVAALITLPVLLYQIWAFARPGLTEREAKGTLAYVPVSFVLFLGGVAFSYYLVFPMMLRFMMQLNARIGALETYGIDRYFSFLFNVVVPLGLSFEMPLVMLFLTRLGVLTPQRLRAVRKYAYVGLAVFASCISPPDAVSHLSVLIPLLALFELSALLATRVYYRRHRAALQPQS
ncbi:twin-arginine translocase subunit TatC [Paenibacillus sp. IB182496]|uniref:Sec-independent protein translocase protein TatC n=1 Tax=Paenibacillus sabuli TaxID=2772509 RepID=A0A927GQ33_9BACL|nr:twin-arginine translocase subunit TatC [Paenibacillus sabuli]MBD2843948.1 twin-arginine translocase subunit TatC [Paenibacillus sabuli]